MTLDLTDLAHYCSNASEFEAAVLRLLKHEVGFDAAFFLTSDGAVSVTTMGLGDTARARLRDRAETYAHEVASVKQAALASRGVAVDTAVCSRQHIRGTSYFREVVATVNGQHSLLAYVPWRGRIAAMLMLGRSGCTFSARDIALVESLLPRLGVARAAFGLPAWTPPPLPSLRPHGLAERFLGFGRPRVLASVRTAHGTLVVRDRDGFREMVAADGTDELVWTRAALGDPSKSGWPYADLFHLAPALATHRTRALFVGCGGGVSLHQFAFRYPGMQLDLVEHEPAVLELAEEWFALNTVPNLTTHVADGQTFVEDSPDATWDIVIVDAYDAKARSSDRLRHASLRSLKRVLRPGGAVAWNLIGSLSRSGPVAHFVSSATRVFDSVRVVPVVDASEDYAPDTLRNIVVIAT